VLGFVGGGVARGLAVGAVVTGVSLFFADLHWQHPLMTVAVIVLTSVLFALAGLINGIYAKSFDDISVIPTFVLTPLTISAASSIPSRCCRRSGKTLPCSTPSCTWSTPFVMHPGRI
jgi:hypothetical protein